MTQKKAKTLKLFLKTTKRKNKDTSTEYKEVEQLCCSTSFFDTIHLKYAIHYKTALKIVP